MNRFERITSGYHARSSAAAGCTSRGAARLGWLVIAAAAALLPMQARAASWAEAIAAVEAQEEKLWQLAHRRGQEGRHIGTLYNEFHANEHSCSILGRMLGKADFIVELEQSTQIDISTTDGHATGVAAHSLGNWAASARRLLDLDEPRRIREWNLDCVGEFGIPGTAWIGENGAPTFFDIDGTTLKVIGNVEEGFSQRLIAVIEENPHITHVALGSAGGSVHEAIMAGVFIRQRNLETLLWNNCFSACTIVFAGGVKRQIWSPYPDLAFHQVSIGGVAVPSDDPVYDRLGSYARLMGIHPKPFLALFRSAPPSDFTRPKSDLLCAANIATWVQRACDAKDYSWN
ncbi:hypothetical protein PANO111632_07710 [Paracoccus nototheniae]|uniref:Uncharacterized protein n=1 Tax=Paracoccus nototheniae TaxID=2489002 RepID=A0ABW4DTA5_9RHOB|nr:hypothetical protein [Paracoccus nototheniae]